MDRKKVRVKRFGRFYLAAAFMIVAVTVGFWQGPPRAQGDMVSYQVDPGWPKPLPAPRDAEGQTRQWVTGDVGASCIDSQDHVITVNRGFQRGGVSVIDGTQSIASPPVLEFDTEGNLVNSWGDTTLTTEGVSATLPHSIHGCFVDYQDNIWISGNSDGIVQKWSHDGTQRLLQIGQRGICDGLEEAPPPPPGRNWFLRPNQVYPTCAEPGLNQSETLLNGIADVYVDPTPDPVTGERGSIYLADGYGNHRIVVFNADGQYLRQWGAPGTGPGQFSVYGGGHPHCVTISQDGLVYACDRENHRIHVTDRQGQLMTTIAIDPPDQKSATWRATDVDFSRDPAQTYLFVMDLGSGKVRILDRMNGREVGSFGRPGPMAGEFRFAHTITVDSQDNVYVAETATGRRIQKFTKIK